MATFTITGQSLMSSLAGKTGNDSYNINGGTLITDCDSRYAPNATATTGPMGNLNVSASLGGHWQVTTENIVLVPFAGSGGTLPAYDTGVTQANGASGVILCVMSDRTGGTVLPGNTPMPANGWLKIRRSSLEPFVNDVLIAPGATFAAVQGEEQAWIMLVGVQDRTHNHPRLGTMQFRGDWFEVGTTNGLRGQLMQLPHFAADAVTAYPGVEIETAPASDVYVFWANAGSRFSEGLCSTDSRSRFVTISETGVMTIGQTTAPSAAACGDLPAAGCRVRIPTIITQTCATTNLNLNIRPPSTIGSRYECVFSSAGRADIRNVTGAWYWNIVQPYSCYINNLHTCEQVIIQEVATPVYSDGLHVGLSIQATMFASNALAVQQCYSGGEMLNTTFVRAEASSTAGYAGMLVNLYGGWVVNRIRGGHIGTPTAVSGSLYINTCDDVALSNVDTFAKRILITGSERITIDGLNYADACIGTTLTTASTHCVEVMGKCEDINISNVYTWPDVVNCHPYNGVVFTNTAASVRVRNIGNSTYPFNAGTVNMMGYLWSDGGNNADVKIQRCWLTGLRTGLLGGTNTTKRLTAENCYTVDASKTIGPQQLDSRVHGNRFNAGGVPSSYIAVYGSAMWDGFTGDTTTRAALIFCEKTSANPDAYQITGGTPVFTAQGALVMRTLGDQITYTWQWPILGWNGLASMATTGTNTPNHLVEYAIDTGPWKVLNSTNLLSEVIDPTLGFTPKIRITTTTANTNNRLDSVRFDGTTTLALQNAALYPLDQATLTLTGLQAGSSVAVFYGTPASGTVPAGSAYGTGTSATLAYEHIAGYGHCTVRIRKAGYAPIDLQYTNAVTSTIPVAQQPVRDGYGEDIYGRGPGTTDAHITLDGAALRIDIGNQLCIAEDVYDVVSAWQATATGMRYPEALRFDGRDLLLMGSWRLRRGLVAYTNAGIDAAVVVDGMATASPDDEINGSVDIRAKAVRTYQLNSTPALTATDIAQAVWAYTLSTGGTSESELLAAKTAAQNAFAVSA